RCGAAAVGSPGIRVGDDLSGIRDRVGSLGVDGGPGPFVGALCAVQQRHGAPTPLDSPRTTSLAWVDSPTPPAGTPPDSVLTGTSLLDAIAEAQLAEVAKVSPLTQLVMSPVVVALIAEPDEPAAATDEVSTAADPPPD